MEIPDIPPAVFFTMIERGALLPHEDHKTFDINFCIVQREFPAFINLLVEGSLNEIERWAWLEGYMHYEVLENGNLLWRLCKTVL